MRAAEAVEPDFDARFSARWRRYRYTVLNDPVPDPFLAATTWHVDRAARPAARCGWPAIRSSASTTSPRSAAGPSGRDGEPAGDAGAPGAVGPLGRRRATSGGCCASRSGPTRSATRWSASIVGTLVEVGLGRRSAGSILGTIRARDRSSAGQLAPPHGLCLWEVGYWAERACLPRA